MKKYDATIAGYLCVDMVPLFNNEGPAETISTLFKPGTLIEIDGLGFSLGGAVANTGIAMKKFNKKVFLNGIVGNDIIGKFARENLDQYNLSEGIQITQKAGTAFSIVIAPKGTDRIFLESPGCSKIFDIGCIDFEAISQSRMFHFGYPPLLREFYINNGEQLFVLFSRVQEMGVVTSLDFSLPDPQSESGKQDWPQIMQRILPYTDIFAPSIEEVLQIMMPCEYAKILSSTGNSDIIDQISTNTIRELGKKIIQCGVKILLIKAGHRGSYILTGDISSLNQKGGFDLSETSWNYREFWCNAYVADPEKIKNATGAGDTAIAAFLSAILDGETAEQAIKFAAVAGRNKLYCHNIYEEINGWHDMAKDIETDRNEIIKFRQ